MIMGRIFQFFKDMKFKYKLLLSYLIVIIIPISILGAYSYALSKDYIKEQTVRELTNSVDDIQKRVGEKIQEYSNIMDVVIYDYKVQRIMTYYYTDWFVLLAELKERLESFITLTIYSKTNVESYNSMLRPYSEVSGEIWAKDAMESSIIKNYYEHGDLLFVKKILDMYSTRDLGIICVSMSPADFFSKCIGIKKKMFTAVITDPNNNVIYCKSTLPDNIPLIPQTKLGNMDTSVLKYSGIEYIIVKREVFKPGWTLYYYVPSSEISHNFGKIIIATMLIIISCIVFLLLIIYIFTITFVRRIQSLNNKMKSIEKGNMILTISSNSKDEIGELTNSFGMMLNRINSLISEVYESKITQKEIELRLLQVCINPHFLYNSLSIINWKAIKIGSSEISNIVTTLASFYRTTLNKGNNFTSFTNEFTNTKAYIDIQLIMHDDSFSVEYGIDEEIYHWDTLNLTLQPIVENAIEHGIDRKRDGKGALRISGADKGDHIEIAVGDNGPGMDKSTMESSLKKKSKGYGLRSVDQRIKIFFGEQYGISVKSILGEGTCVYIKLPKYKSSE